MPAPTMMDGRGRPHLSSEIRFQQGKGFDFFDPWGHQAILYLPFFLLGVLAKETSCELLVERMSPQVLFLAGTAGILFAETLQFSADPSPQSRLLPSLLAAAGFILMAAGISRKSLHSRLSGCVMHVGKASMVIYLVHIFFTAFSRIGLMALEIHDLWLHVIIGTLFGVFGPLLVLHLADRWNLRRALGF